MPDRQALEHAITVLGAQRANLGDAVVDVSLNALRRKLEAIASRSPRADSDHIAVLAAQRSYGESNPSPTDVADRGDPDDTLLERLANTVKEWGGIIRELDDSGLVALFGTRGSLRDDCERAILAALDLQMALALHGEGAASPAASPTRITSEQLLRIGVDCGPVPTDDSGMPGESPDAIAVSIELLKHVPPGGILISQQVYSQVHTVFEADASVPIAVDGRTGLFDVYQVKREKPRRYRNMTGNAEASAQRLVGRQAELERLQQALQATADDGCAHFFVVEGEAGVGKSRLLHEFEQTLTLLPTKVNLFGGQAVPGAGHLAYGLIRDIFFDSYGIHARSDATITHAKLCRGFMGVTKENGETALALADAIGRFLGFSFEDGEYLGNMALDADQTRDITNKIVAFFKAAVSMSPATILVLEDIHWADEKSLDLIDHVFQECRDDPVLFICSGRTSLLEKRLSWYPRNIDGSSQFESLKLAPLTPIDSRHLVLELFQGSPQLPMRIVEMIVEQTGGNPADIEALSKALVDSGVLIREATRWRAQLAGFKGMAMLPTLTSLLQRRLEQLPDSEKETLQRASIFGRFFWKSAITKLAQTAGNGGSEQTTSAINSLEQRDLIYRRNLTRVQDTEEYAFRDEKVRRIVYESIEAPERRIYHARAANWLVENVNGSAGAYASTIAKHFESAGDLKRAATWYGRAGKHAQMILAPKTAIRQFRRGLSLLSLELENVPDRIRFYESLGKSLRLQARFAEAIEAFSSMAAAAQASDDPASEARSHLGCFLTQQLQHDYAAALMSSQKAEQVARKSGLPQLLATAHAGRAWALACLNDSEAAMKCARESLRLGMQADSNRERAFANAVTGVIYRNQSRLDQAVDSTRQALSFFRESGERFWEGMLLGNLGQAAFDRHEHEAALESCQQGLLIASEVGDKYGMMRCLRLLAKIAQRAYQDNVAEKYLRDAYDVAERCENRGLMAYIASDLGWHHLEIASATFRTVTDIEREAHVQRSQTWLQHALKSARGANVPVVAVVAHSAMARLLAEQGLPEDALPLAQKALNEARRSFERRPGRDVLRAVGVAWRVMGLVASELSPADLPVFVGGKKYDATACYERCVRAFAAIGGAAEDQIALTLYEWARLELHEGDREQGVSLWNQAFERFTKLDMARELAWMERANIQ